MKKVILVIVAAAVVFGVGYFACRFGAGAEPATSSNPVSSVSPASSQAMVSSAVPQNSAPLASAEDSAVPPPQSMTQTQKQQSIKEIEAAISLNWKKYTLKKAYAKTTVKGKSYLTFEIWDQDYVVGPTVLVDETNNKIYTWTPSDTALVPAASDPAFDRTVRSVTGTMTDGSMMSIVLKTANGSELTIRRLGIDTSGLTSMKIGDKIKVTYTGVIKGGDTSRAFVTKLENVK